MRFVMQDGEVRPDGRISLDVDDLAFARGLGVFDTLRTYAGRPVHLDVHLDRLTASAAALGVPMPDRALLRAEVRQAAAALPGEAVVRISLTAGGSRIVQASLLPEPPTSVRVATRPFPEHPWLSGRVKHISRAVSIVAVRDAGVDEVFWVDRGGMLLEGTWSNIFAVRDGVLCTPADDGRILSGITRSRVLAAARSLGLPVAEGGLPAVGPFDELYLSSSLKLLCPVVELDGAPAPGAGPVGDQLAEALRAAGEAPPAAGEERAGD